MTIPRIDLVQRRTLGPSPDTALRQVTVSAAALTITIVGAGVAVGTATFSGVSDDGGSAFALEGTSGEVLLQILGRNLSALLLLFSGYATLGITTVLGLVLTSTYVGATGEAIIAGHSLGGVDPLVWLYIPLEFGGLLVVAVAGLLPLTGSVARWLVDRRAAPGAITRRSLRLLALGLLLVLAGAVVETGVIALRG